jgi:hypothetical protein
LVGEPLSTLPTPQQKLIVVAKALGLAARMLAATARDTKVSCDFRLIIDLREATILNDL